MPLLSVSESMARTPVWAEMKLMALTTEMRESRELSSTVWIHGVVNPLMLTVPVTAPVPDMAAPVMMVGLTVATTPVALVLELKAAALEMALAIWLPEFCGDNLSSTKRDAPMGMPLMMASLANMVSRELNLRETLKPTTSSSTKSAATPTLSTWLMVTLPPDNKL